MPIPSGYARARSRRTTERSAPWPRAAGPSGQHEDVRLVEIVGQTVRVANHTEEQLVLSLVLDGLDDLYDQRFGAPVGSDPVTRAEVCLLRVLVPSGVALAGSDWGPRLLRVADEIRAIMREGLRGDDLTDRVLTVTGALRADLARAV